MGILPALHLCITCVPDGCRGQKMVCFKDQVRSADPETRAIAFPLCALVELFQDGLKFQILQWNTW